MPNHIKNRLTIKADYDKVQEIVSMYGTHIEAKIRCAFDGSFICLNESGSVGWLNPKTGEFTTRTTAPQMGIPDGYNVELESAYFQFPDLDKVIKEPEEIKHENPEFLSDKSYEFRKDNWGTKWNTYSHEIESYNVFWFETAWQGIPKIILEISAHFSDVEFLYDYADEDTGYNVGKYVIVCGRVVSENVPDVGTNEAYEIAFELRTSYKEDFIIVDGEYKYKEDE